MTGMILLTILACSFASAAAHIEIKRVPDTTPMLFNMISDAMVSYDNVKMVYYINMTQYFDLMKLIDKTAQIGENICEKLPQDICHLQIERLKMQLTNTIREDDEIKAGRRPRGVCDWCGTGLYYAFGVMDATRAKEYADFINNLSDEQKKQHAIMQNSTTLFQLFLKNNKQSLKKIHSELSVLQEDLNNFSSHVDFQLSKLSIQSELHSVIQLATTEVNEHFQMYSHLKAALSNTKDHRIPDFIPLTQLSTDIFKVASTLKPGQQLPVEILKEDPLRVFDHAKTSSILIDELLITEITIPIAERTRYIRYKATPIPIQTPSGRLIAKISNPYFLTNAMQTEFIPLTEIDLIYGQKMTGNTYLYKPSPTVQLKSNNVCAWKILMENSMESALSSCNFVPLIENDIIISIVENESYFFASKNPTNIWEICDQENGKLTQLEGRNIIKLDNTCSVKSSSFIIKPHVTAIFNQTATVIPPMPSTREAMSKLFDMAQLRSTPITMPDHEQILIANTDEMDEIIRRSDILASAANHRLTTGKLIFESQLLSYVSSAVIFLTIALIIATLAFLAYRKFNIFSTVLNAAGMLIGGKLPPQVNIPINDIEHQRPRPTPRAPRRNRQFEDEEIE